MKGISKWGVGALAAFGWVALLGSCDNGGVSQAEFDALVQTVNSHRTASQAWATQIKAVVDCLEMREFVGSAGCPAPPDPPSTPPPNSGW